MNTSKIKIIIFLFALLFLPIKFVIAQESNFQQQIYEITQCNDGIDNDGDGSIDYASDADCSSWDDKSELAIVDENSQLNLNQNKKVEVTNTGSTGIQDAMSKIKNFFSNILGDLSNNVEDSTESSNSDGKNNSTSNPGKINDDETQEPTDTKVVNKEVPKESNFNFLWEPLGKVLSEDEKSVVSVDKPIGIVLRVVTLASISAVLIILRVIGKI